jgi:hypothetical protein
MPAVVDFLRRVLIHREDLWTSCVTVFTHDTRILEHTPLVLIFKTGDELVSRTLVHSDPKIIWGLTGLCGGGGGCMARPGEVVSKTRKVRNDTNHPTACWVCSRCGWESIWVARPEWIKGTGHPLTFYYTFPLTEEQAGLVERLARKKVDGDML